MPSSAHDISFLRSQPNNGAPNVAGVRHRLRTAGGVIGDGIVGLITPCCKSRIPCLGHAVPVRKSAAPVVAGFILHARKDSTPSYSAVANTVLFPMYTHNDTGLHIDPPCSTMEHAGLSGAIINTDG